MATTTFGGEVKSNDIVAATGPSHGKAQKLLAELTWIVRNVLGRKNWLILARPYTNGRT